MSNGPFPVEHEGQLSNGPFLVEHEGLIHFTWEWCYLYPGEEDVHVEHVTACGDYSWPVYMTPPLRSTKDASCIGCLANMPTWR